MKSEKQKKFERFRQEIDGDSPRFLCGMLLESKEDLDDALREQIVKLGRSIKTKKSDKGRIRATCEATNCTWKLLVRKLDGNTDWQVKTLNSTRKCSRPFDPRLCSLNILLKVLGRF